ncbi:MAG: 30S ribosomal protein S27e [Thermoplasmata archaeon]
MPGAKKGKFAKVKCKDCSNEQIVFLHASTMVKCEICGATIAKPAGGKADIRGEIVEIVG